MKTQIVPKQALVRTSVQSAVAVVTLLFAVMVRADLNYAEKPLFYATGVQPNVALMIDDSGSMASGDAGGSYSYVSTCSNATINYNTYTAASPDAGRGDDGCGGSNNYTSNNDTDCSDGNRLERSMSATSQLDRLEAAQQAACQVVNNNAASMRIGLYSFLSGNDGEEMLAFGSTIPTLKNSIYGMTHGRGTPLTSTLRVIANRYIGAGSPIQYRCQKNYVVYFTDGEPSTGVDYAGDDWQDDSDLGLEGDQTFTWPSISPAQPSPWAGSGMSTGATAGSPGWDGYPDPIYNAGSGANAHPFLDDMAQMMYDVDFKTNSSTTPAAACGGTAPATGKDCAGKSWDGDDDDDDTYAHQRIITYTLGMGAEANNGLLRNTPLVNRIAINPTDVNVAANTIRVVAHGLETGDYVQYHRSATDVTYTTTATANTGTEVLTGDTTNMATGDRLTYNNGGGSNLQYGVTSTTPGPSCGQIGGLTSGDSYYISAMDANTFRLSSWHSANAYICSTLADSASNVSDYCWDLTGRGTAGTTHTFTRTNSTAGFNADDDSNTFPVNLAGDYITVNGHPFSTGDLVTYTRRSSTTSIGGLSHNSNYYVAVTGPNTFKLATSAANASTCASGGTNCINLTGTGDDNRWQQFSKVASGSTSFVATGSGTSPVNITSDIEKMTSAGHGFRTGDIVTYTCTDGADTVTVTPTTATTYYAIVNTVGNPGTFRLATSSANAFSTTAVDLVAAGTAAQNFTWTKTVNQALIGGLYAYATDRRPDGDPNPATELSARGKYFVNVVDGDTLKLQECGDVFDCISSTGVDVDLTSVGYGFLSTGPGRSYFASTAEQLSDALTQAFADIRGAQLSFASVASNSSEKTVGTRLYQARFNPGDWSGDVRALQFAGAQIDNDNPTWRAYDNMPAPAARNIWTRSGTSTLAFNSSNFGSLTAAQQTALSNGVSAAMGQNVMDWIRGSGISGLRVRNNGVIGDIINSSLMYVGQPGESGNYAAMLPDDPFLCSGNVCTGKNAWSAFTGVARRPAVYAGSNAGVLHGFDASNGLTQGDELLAFIPSGAYMDWNDLDNDAVKDAGEPAINKFYEVAQEYYGVLAAQPHRYLVDGSPVAGNAYFGSLAEWRTVLVGGLGRGGRTVYALDVTDPVSFDASDVLWEFSSPNMGYSYSRPAIARLNDGRWAAIFGNGYDSAGDSARLFIVNIENGTPIYEINLGTSGGLNGLSSVSVSIDRGDYDGDGDELEALAVYAGDLRGNVWKIDLSGSLAVAPPASVFFTATDAAGNRQPITSDITLAYMSELDALDGAAKEAGLMLLFGTGTYFQNEDISYNYPTSGVQHDTLYGLWDNGTGVATLPNPDLVQQNLGERDLDVNLNGVIDPDETFRTITRNPVDYASGKRGWYVRLAVTTPAAVYNGERIVFSPTVNDSFVYISTVIPADADPCIGGGDSKFYRLNSLTGGANAYSLFDRDGDGSGDPGGGSDDTTDIVGYGFEGVLISKPVVLEDGDKDIPCFGRSDGTVQCLDPPPEPCPDGSARVNGECPDVPDALYLKGGRMGWRQLQ